MSRVKLQEALGIDLPIIQAPLAGVQDARLAVAVSNAGGLGSLPCAMLDADGIRRELDAIIRQSVKPYNVNFFCHPRPRRHAAREESWRNALAPYYLELGLDAATVPFVEERVPFGPEAAEILDDFRPPVVSFHFGLPSRDLLDRVRRWGSTILSSATTVEEAVWLEERGVDIVIAQGIEAGGHRGMFLTEDPGTQLPTLALLERILDAVDLPVVAAGGIADAEAVAEAMARGAAGAQVGTAYLLCTEATTSPAHRRALLSDAGRRTAVTNLFTGRPARGIVNRLMRELGPMSDLVPEFPLAAALVSPLRAKAEAQGLADFSPLWAGTDVSGCREVPAAQLTAELAAGLA